MHSKIAVSESGSLSAHGDCGSKNTYPKKIALSIRHCAFQTLRRLHLSKWSLNQHLNCFSPNKACTDGALTVLAQLIPWLPATGPPRAAANHSQLRLHLTTLNLGIQKSGNLGICNPSEKENIEIHRMQIRSAQNVGKVQISIPR